MEGYTRYVPILRDFPTLPTSSNTKTHRASVSEESVANSIRITTYLGCTSEQPPSEQPSPFPFPTYLGDFTSFVIIKEAFVTVQVL